MLGTRRATVARLVEDRVATHPELRQQPTMVRGPHAIDVELLQRRLNEDGATPPLNVDGIFGPLTHNATVAFQGRHGLTANGVVELRTWGMIDELSRQGIAGPQSTVLDQTTPVTQTQHDDVEAILHPGHTGGVPGPAMTGTGVGGEYETEGARGARRARDRDDRPSGRDARRRHEPRQPRLGRGAARGRVVLRVLDHAREPQADGRLASRQQPDGAGRRDDAPDGRSGRARLDRVLHGQRQLRPGRRSRRRCTTTARARRRTGPSTTASATSG